MAITWNEVRQNAIKFSNEWKYESSEKAEAQTFWNEFFDVFGISRRRVASFEKHIQINDDRQGYIDLFWKGTLVVEHKSEGEDLDKAYSQALDYFNGLDEVELPKYVIVTDFKNFRVYDLDEDKEYTFKLANLSDNIHIFDFMLGYKKRSYKDEDPVNIKAAELMGDLHDSLKQDGYVGHSLEMLLVRLMFCLFADDTGIFEKGAFTYYLENKTNEDGSNVGQQLTLIFQILNTPLEKRQKSLDEDLQLFCHVNGTLFDEPLPIPVFSRKTRELLLKCSYFDWSKVSPAIFGSMFQHVMDKEKRRDIGGHYTSEKNVMKIIKNLFLDDLWKDYNKHKNNKKYLEEMLKRIAKMKFLDPACGCGNFLIISYRELRKLQIEIHKQLRKKGTQTQQIITDISEFNKDINVDAMYGIEELEFPVRIAEVALWLVDHQMNIELSKELGTYFVRLPLKTTPNIIQGNALRMDWNEIVPKNELNYILGNPPFIGKKRRDGKQNEDMKLICGHIKNFGILDYVCCWYVKAEEYIRDTKIKVAFVSTNSITQGEQVGVLWEYLLFERNIFLHFAHRTFRWHNKARGLAHVHVVIIGFALFDIKKKYLYDYQTLDSDPLEMEVSNINPYLVNDNDIIIKSRSKPINKIPLIKFGSMPNDDGNFLFTNKEKKEFLKVEPDAKKFMKPFISAKEFLHDEKRWCLWLEDVLPSELKDLKHVQERIKNVREYRLNSKREKTKELADYPYLFAEIRQPKNNFILIPRVSSENRIYIPMAFFDKNYIVGDTCLCIPNGTLYHFGILTSAMHMTWVRQICGRLESRYRYSNRLVYNNYPWPENPSKKKIESVEKYAKELIDIRKEFKEISLAELYNPIYMPKKLLSIHKKLDRAVDKCYHPKKSFKIDVDRLKFLFELYKKYID